MVCSKLFTFILATLTLCSSNVHGTKAETTDMIIDPENFPLGTVASPASIAPDDWNDWENWEPSEFVVRAFPCYRSGYDHDGLVVGVAEFGKENFRELARMPEEKRAEVWKAYEQWTRWMEKDAALNNGQGVVLIIDFDGFSLANYGSSEALKLGLRVFSYLIRQHKAIRYGFLINVNYAAETWINLARPFLGTFLDAVEICGTRSEIWKPKLLRKIPSSQLPPKYGGSQDWKCLAPAYRCKYVL